MTSFATGCKWYADTMAAEEIEGLRSTMADLKNRSTETTDEAFDMRCLVRYRFDTRERGRHAVCTHIDDPSKSPNSVRPVDHLQIGLHILHDRRSHHDYVLGNAGQLFNDEVNHLPEGALRR
jgi:hypothetical protein